MFPEPIPLKPPASHGMDADGITRPRHPRRPGTLPDRRDRRSRPRPRDRVASAIEEGRRTGKMPEEVLIEQGALNAEGLSRAVAERHGLDHLDLGTFKPDMAAANLISISAAKRYEAVPVEFLDDRTLLVAMADPSNVLAVDDIALLTGKEIRPAVTSREDILNLISRLTHLDDVVTTGDLFGDERRRRPGGDRRPARVRRRRAGHQARQPDHRPGRRAGRVGHPPRAQRQRAARALPDRRRARRDRRRSSGAWCSA